jgi:DNA-binding transcriptional LysR family regulator
MYDWDDLKFVIAVARNGSTLSAARALGVNQSTVQRRIAALELALGCILVERHQSGYRLTELAESVLPYADSVAAGAKAFEEQLKTAEAARTGTLRLTCPEPIAARLTASGLIDRFCAAHPGLEVEFVLSDKYVDLSKGEADVALRSGDTDDDILVGRKIADSIWAIYASRAYLARTPAPSSLATIADHALVGFDESLRGHRLSVWLASAAPNARYAARSHSVLGLVSAAKSGVGLAALPVALGDSEPDLVRVLPVVPELTRAWRILCHPDVRHSRRVSAFYDFVQAELESFQPILSG